MLLQDLLGIKYPFIQGGMANIGTGEFACAVSEAGGLGLISSGGNSLEELESHIDYCKANTDKPFGVNLMLLEPQADEMAKLIAKKQVPVITTGAGNPAKYIEMWKEAGAKIFPVIPSPTLARRMERYDVDGVIAEGMEAGGHIGKMTTMTLLPQTVEAVNIPVIGAGGFASGEQLFAGEILGASGFQLGTIFLATEECPIHDKYKEAIIDAKDNKVTVIGEMSGLANRVLRNSMTKKYEADEKLGKSLEELEVYTLGALKKAVYDGDVENGSLMAGLVVGQIKEIMPVKDLMEKLYVEYTQARETFRK